MLNIDQEMYYPLYLANEVLHFQVDSVHHPIPGLASPEKMILTCFLGTYPSLMVSVSGHTVVEAVA